MLIDEKIKKYGRENDVILSLDQNNLGIVSTYSIASHNRREIVADAFGDNRYLSVARCINKIKRKLRKSKEKINSRRSKRRKPFLKSQLVKEEYNNFEDEKYDELDSWSQK